MNQTKPTATKELPVKRARFVDYYVESGNATESYLRAGYTCNGPSVARTEGHRLLTIPSVRQAIDAKTRQLQIQNDLTAHDVIQGLHGIATNSDEPASARVSSWSKLADILGLVTRKVSIESERSETRNELQRMFTVSELLELRERMVASERKVLPEETVIDVDVVDVTVTEKG